MTLDERVATKGLRLHRLTQNKPTDMKYEVFAPVGFRYTGGEHSRVFLNAWDLNGFLNELAAIATAKCPDDCDCREKGDA